MCGRFALDAPSAKIKAQFHIEDLEELTPRYNIPPGLDVLFVCHPDGEQSNKALWLRWGLVPFWAKDKKIGHSLANARAETVAEKPAFRQSFKSRRGIIVMSGFFEWKQGVKKQPFYFKNKHDDLLAVAALWDSWQGPEGELIQSCCLLTTSANKLMEPVHNRMPVLLNNDTMQLWMDNSHCNQAELLGLLKPYSQKDLICYPVTTKMSNARFTQHESIEPIN